MSRRLNVRLSNLLVSGLIILGLAEGGTSAAVAEAAGASIAVTAPSVVLLEPESGRVLFSKAPYRRQPPASTAKIVTALVVLESLPLDKWVTVSTAVQFAEPSKLYLRAGEEIRVRDLLKALLMNSANDAAMALAIATAGSERAFAGLMNEKAKSLGAQDTHFINSSGLPGEGQYSTAHDLALFIQIAMKNGVIASILKQRRATIETAQGKRYYLSSHNKMLLRGRNVYGKTGYTRSARYCFVGWIQRSNSRAVVSMLGSRKLWDDLTTITNQYTGVTPKQAKVIAFGARGDRVKELQRVLKQRGYFKGPVTGYFGQQTRSAVIRFQKAKGLLVDGTVGPQTKSALGI